MPNYDPEMIEEVKFKFNDKLNPKSYTKRNLSKSMEYSVKHDTVNKLSADIEIKFKDGNTLNYYHKVTETDQNQIKEMCKPVSNLFLNKNNYISI